MSQRQKLAAVTAGAVVLVLVTLVTVPLLFRDRIEARLESEIEARVDAHVDWSRVRLSLLRGFPDLTLRVDGLAVHGRDRFEGDTLVAVPRARMVLDLASVVRNLRRGEPLLIRSLEFEEPALHLIVLEDGTANWDIARADDTPADAPPRAFDVTLRSWEVRGGSLVVEDRESGVVATMTGIRQALAGDFARERFTLRTSTGADAVSLRFGGVPYLSGVRLDLQAELEVDTQAGRIVVRDNAVRLNDLVLDLTGSATMAEDSVALDLRFQAPSTAFGEILSLVPALYTRDFETLRTSGSMRVEGWIRGGYGPEAFPALSIEAGVENGTFRYPDLPLSARDVTLDLSVSNPGGDPDRTVLNLRRFHVLFGDDAVEGSMVVRTPLSDPDIDLRAEGRIDLADVRRTVKLEGVDELRGVIALDAAVHARMSDVDAGRWERVGAEGRLDVSDLILEAGDLPHPLMVDEALLELTPSHAELTSFRGRLGASDLSMTGRLDNLLGFALRDEVLRGHANVTSRNVDLDDWRSEDDARAVPVPGAIDFTLDAAVERLTLGELRMSNARGRVQVRDRRLTLDDFRLDLLGGEMALTGYYETTDPVRPVFDMDLRLTEVDVPAAFASIGTVRAFAPVAEYAAGTVSVEVRLAGELNPDLTPVLGRLSGLGGFRTAGLRLHDFPPLDQLSERLDLPLLRDPGFQDLRSTLVIREGRLHVNPFDVGLGPLTMTVAGSNGLDRSLDYTLGLELPRTALGSGAERAVVELISRSSRAGLTLQPADVIELGARLSGTIRSPSIDVDFRGLARSAAREVEDALREEAGRRIDEAAERLDAATEEARARAAAEAARIVSEAESRASTIRAEAEVLAASIRREGVAQADALLARATNPAARLAARPAAERLRREADEQADRVVREADARADALVAEARRRAGLEPDA